MDQAGASAGLTGDLEQHSRKPTAVQGAVSSSLVWTFAFGQMLIETCIDGSVWIDGKPVLDTLTRQAAPLVKATDD
jgi:hypothetical protein